MMQKNVYILFLSPNSSISFILMPFRTIEAKKIEGEKVRKRKKKEEKGEIEKERREKERVSTMHTVKGVW